VDYQMVLEEVGRQVELMDSFRESVMQATTSR
jgi:hypothetical protein